MADIGKTISECISLISKVGAECEVLALMLKQELNSLLSNGSVRKYVVAGPWEEASLTDSNQWVYTDIAYSLPVIMKPKRKIGAYLSFQISFVGTGIAALDNNQPLLHVGFWSKAVDFDECWMGFPLDDSPRTLEHGQLFRWTTSSESLSEWVYSLRLAEMNTMQDIQEKVVVPVTALLLGESAADAFVGTAKSIVRYCEIEGSPGQYRVVQ
ncbi:hypothetical protein ACNFB1_18590 [Pseudomonas sp. NY15349]|uniref:hypothetical protein n=1 Tax=Pseudomonas sp. NY15349 TaxID=3400350 RepID=UPI003A868099